MLFLKTNHTNEFRRFNYDMCKNFTVVRDSNDGECIILSEQQASKLKCLFS
uniref:Uncharacterized protein n=1 Tax=Rhizophora mucronata TaxID=61149 RepID=A0A2P2NVW5_RHIMU